MRSALIGGLLLLLATGSAAATEILRLQLLWVPQAQFAGFYLAEDRGWYAEAGLDVRILAHGPEHDPVAALERNRADVALLYLTQALKARDQGIPVVNIGQLIHHSSLALVSRRELGILGPEDLHGRRVARWPGFALQPEALFQAYGIEPDIIDQGPDMTLFTRGVVDVAMATAYNELVELYLSGMDAEDLSLLWLQDHGVGLVEDGIYVLQTILEERHDALHRFVETSLRGWRAAFDDPQAAVDAVMARAQTAGIRTNRAHQLRMIDALRPLYLREDGTLRGPLLCAADYDRAHGMMTRFGELENDPVPLAAFHLFPDHAAP